MDYTHSIMCTQAVSAFMTLFQPGVNNTRENYKALVASQRSQAPISSAKYIIYIPL